MPPKGSESECWRAYRTLMRAYVFSEFRWAVFALYLPLFTIMLQTKSQVESFKAFMASNSTSAGPHIRALWLVAGIKARDERALGELILKSCTRLRHLACNIGILRVLLDPSLFPNFTHHKLKFLTLIEPIIPWSELLQAETGRQFFSQLTHFRGCGGTTFKVPRFRFKSLTHLSFTCYDTAYTILPLSFLKDTTIFPSLQLIVPSIPYMQCRTQDPNSLRKLGLKVDERMEVIACPKKWKEIDIWKAGINGVSDIWKSAQSGAYLQKSRAFQQQQPRAYWRDSCDYWDYDSDYEFGGETGL